MSTTTSNLCGPCTVGPGALLPVSLILQYDAPAAGAPVIDALVTVPIPAGTALGFRFYPHDATFLAPTNVSLVFVTLYDCLPGDFVRVVWHPSTTGMALNRLRYSCSTEGPYDVDTLLIASCTATFTPVELVGPYNVFLYTLARSGVSACNRSCTSMVGLSAIASSTSAILPSPCVLPCAFAIVPDGLENDPAPEAVSVSLMASEAIGYPERWSAAWQWIKYGAWTAFDVVDYEDTVSVAESYMYVAGTPGMLIPLAVKPHVVHDAWTAQVAFVVTTTIAAGTLLALSAQLPAGNGSVPVPYWLWYAPATADVCPGAVLSFTNLGVVGGVLPGVNVGTVVRAPFLEAYAGPDLDLTDFTVFSAHPCLLTATGIWATEPHQVQYVTALYTCARPAGAPLPSTLVAGVSMPAGPWPDGPAVLPVPQTGRACVPVPKSMWRAKGIALAGTTPVPWCCGATPLPCFATGTLTCAACE
jgi:hypothetical protein